MEFKKNVLKLRSESETVKADSAQMFETPLFYARLSVPFFVCEGTENALAEQDSRSRSNEGYGEEHAKEKKENENRKPSQRTVPEGSQTRQETRRREKKKNAEESIPRTPSAAKSTAENGEAREGGAREGGCSSQQQPWRLCAHSGHVSPRSAEGGQRQLRRPSRSPSPTDGG